MNICIAGLGVGLLIGAFSIAPLFLFIASIGITPNSILQNLILFLFLCIPSALVGAVSERQGYPIRQHRYRRIIPYCLGAAFLGALICAIPAYGIHESKTDASMVCFLALGWLSGMQGAFFIVLSRPPRSKVLVAPADEPGMDYGS
jgi:hypothetical protein